MKLVLSVSFAHLPGLPWWRAGHFNCVLVDNKTPHKKFGQKKNSPPIFGLLVVRIKYKVMISLMTNSPYFLSEFRSSILRKLFPFHEVKPKHNKAKFHAFSILLKKRIFLHEVSSRHHTLLSTEKNSWCRKRRNARKHSLCPQETQV